MPKEEINNVVVLLDKKLLEVKRKFSFSTNFLSLTTINTCKGFLQRTFLQTLEKFTAKA